MNTALITHLIHAYGYYALFTLIAVESLGIPLPGETALITAAIYAGRTHHLNIGVLALVAAAAAILGDNAGYWIGKTGGLSLAERYGRYLGLDQARLKVVRSLFAGHGAKVVFYGRFVALLRTFAAFFAGVSRMRWSRFLLANTAGGLLWVSFYAFGGYALGGAASRVGGIITIVGYVLASLVTVATVVLGRRLRYLESPRAVGEPAPAESAVVAGRLPKTPSHHN